MEKLMDSFINNCGNSFLQYFERYRYKNLINREDYKALYDKKQTIFNEFPNVRTFLQDRMIIELTDDDIPAVVLSAYVAGNYTVYVDITNSSSHTLTVTYLDFDSPLTNKVVDTIPPSSKKSLSIADTRKYGLGAQYMFIGSPIVVDIAD